MATIPDFIKSQRKTHKGTTFACYVRNYTENAVSFPVAFGTLEHQPRMRPEQHARLIERNSARYGVKREGARPAQSSPSLSSSSAVQKDAPRGQAQVAMP